MDFPLERAVGHAAAIAPSVLTAARLEFLIMKAGLARFQPPPRQGPQRYGKDDLVASTIHAATVALRHGDNDVADELKAFLLLVAGHAADEQLDGLVEAARAAGFDLRRVDASMRLLPLDEPASPLSRAITALEADFDLRGLTTARKLYRDAVDSLIDERAEAANGLMRSVLEEVVIQVAIVCGFSRTKQGDFFAALKHLTDNDHLRPNEGADYIRGLWAITHTNGPHPGTSPTGEAHFRVQAMSSAARYLIDRFLPVA